jgi:hypothetical protein
LIVVHPWTSDRSPFGAEFGPGIFITS